MGADLDSPQLTAGPQASSNNVPAISRELGMFFGLTFLLSWGLGGLYLLLRAQLDPVFGPMGPHNAIFYVAAYAPTLAAVATATLLDGAAACRALFAGLLRPFHLAWLAVAALIAPALALALTLLARPGSAGWPVTPHMIVFALPAVLFATPQILTNTGPLGEELGWRGYALPRLLLVSNAFLAAMVLGAIWTLWHVPAFFVAGIMGQSLSGFGWWSLDTFALSITVTWIFLRANGNVFVAGIVPHFVINGMGAIGAWLSRPPEAVALAVTAIGLVIIDHRRFFANPRVEPHRALSLRSPRRSP
jgi:uncharacterized protein